MKTQALELLLRFMLLQSPFVHRAPPSPHHWAYFNASLDGQLVRVQPPAVHCYNETYDAQKCMETKLKWNDSSWRSGQIGAMFSTSWEQRSGDWCLPGDRTNLASKTFSCAQGNVPAYGVIATEPSHLVRAVGFARRHRLKLRVKGTGHDFLGRSTDPHSLLVWTHRMRDITIGSSTICGSTYDTVTVGAGQQWGEVYTALQAVDRVIPGGADPDVGASGGQVMGGGHSPLSNTYGLTTDSILQFRVVTTDGRLLTVNQCKHADLFWAMRGGGGGTYAIAVSTTFRTYKDSPMVVARINTKVTTEGYRNALDVLGMFSPSLADARWTGYFYLFGDVFQAVFFLPLLHNGTLPQATGTIATAFRLIESQSGVQRQGSSIRMFSSFEDARRVGITTGIGGNSNIIGSRLIPRVMLETSASRRLVSKTLASIKAKSGRPILGHFVAGNEVTSRWEDGGNDNAVHPAWREAIWHMVVLNSVPVGGSSVDVQAAFDYLTKEQLEPLRAITAGGGAYGNEGDAQAPTWKDDFFGENYSRLLSIKRRYDKDGLLMCNRCVGSDDF